MNKKYVFLIVFFISIFCKINVNAEEVTSYVNVIADKVYVRKGPSTKYSSLGTVSTPEKYRALSNNKVNDELMNGSCNEGWYNIDYNGTSAYICSKYSDLPPVEASPDCITNLKNQGFPSDYSTLLCQLNSIHPTWKYVPVITNIEWSTAVTKESTCGKSYIETSKPEYIDTSCKSAYSSTSSWKPASQKAVAYYLDPRNWLNEKTIFQFNTNKYEDNLNGSYSALARNIIKNANFYSYHFGIGNDLAEIINQAGALPNVRISPTFIASRMIQELGSKTSEYDLYSGIYPGYENLYNFFNIGVSDSCATTSGVAVCGLTYARNSGWNSPLNAIAGGAQFIANSYVNKGQYTTYLQKFNVTPTSSSSLFSHQYMTNIAAPQSEAKTMYSSIVSAGLLESPFVFYIPIYNNMSENIENSPSGAIDDPTNSNTTTTSIDTLITSVGLKYVNQTVQGINVGTTINDMKGSIESVAGTGNVKILNANNEEIVDGFIGTGYKLQVNTSSGTNTLTIIVKGDTSGDGKINALDLAQVQKAILGTYNLNNEYYTAGDTSGDGKINALDLAQVQKSILGTYTIEQ